MKGIIVNINGNSTHDGIIVFARSLPDITPNDPPDTNIAECESLPSLTFKVLSAPLICKNALPKHIINKLNFKNIVIVTTRAIRENEVDGIDKVTQDEALQDMLDVAKTAKEIADKEEAGE